MMTGEFPRADPGDLTHMEVMRLLAGDRGLRGRLEAGESLRAVTPFQYPGRRGPVALLLVPMTASGDPAGPSAPAVTVRISEGGDLIKSLDEQGMDLALDMILSKTVFHAVQQLEGATVAGGQIYIDSPLDSVPVDLWRFLQLVAEIIGLRHSKYKDALLRLSRRQDGPELIGWENR